jgi:uroporphyrinogen-III synthase/siroheme synthase
VNSLGRLVLCSHGPGDPDLLPVRTVNVLARATLALYPESTPPGVVALISPAARREVFPLTTTYLPGERTWADVRQEVAAGGIVVRLYPDSPQIDPVALREARMLSRDGVGFEIVAEPALGLQAATHCGVPLDLDRGPVTLIGEHPIAPLSMMVSGTAIVMVGRMERPHEAAENLMRAGYSSTTPCLVIQHPTLPSQELRESMLGSLSARPGSAMGGILVAGDAVRQRSTFDWFERLPLFRKRVLITRAQGQASEMSTRLRELGAEPVEFPTIEIVPPSDVEPLIEAIGHISDYDWVVFTSANGVAAFFAQLDACGMDLRALSHAKIAAVGKSTDGELRAYGVKTDYVPQRFVAEEVLAGLLERGVANARVLLPRAEQAREVLPDELRRAGATVDVVSAYRTVQAEPAPHVLARVRHGDIDIVTLTSSSTARNLSAILAGKLELLAHAHVACISPVTAATARKLGFHVDIVAEEYSIPGLIAAMVAASERSTS